MLVCFVARVLIFGGLLLWSTLFGSEKKKGVMAENRMSLLFAALASNGVPL